jgi:hypothetical protein
MNTFLLGALTSFGLGAFTIIHPCPLSTNAAAVSLLYAWKQSAIKNITIVLFFILGEVITFASLGALISIGMINIPLVADFLQSYMRPLLGLLLIIAGMMLSGILRPRQKMLGISERFMKTYSRSGIVGSLVLGILIALSFCPMSAAIFLGVLIPLAISAKSVILYPVFFGMGSSMPLLFIALLISRGTVYSKNSFFTKRLMKNRLGVFAGITMILLGIIMSLRYVFKIV